MKCNEVIRIIEERFPPALAEEWDNPGLLVGDPASEVNTVFVALDASDDIVGEAAKAHADLLITHHPMIFRPVANIRQDDFLGRRIISLIKSGIGLYAAHTNYDIAGMAQRNADMLGLRDCAMLDKTCEASFDTLYAEADGSYGYGRVGALAEEMTLGEFAAKVKSVFRLGAVRLYGDPEKMIRRAAVSSGAGKSSLGSAIDKGADVLVTGDVDYHTAIDALMRGIAVIDAGHYGTEFCFISDMAAFLTEKCPDLIIRTAAILQPYSIL